MSNTHIISTLENKPFNGLSSDDIATVESHIASCDECRFAYEAARITGGLIQARAAEATVVGPFFNTRVMAAIRQSPLSQRETPLVRMWRAAGALVSAMALLLVILAGMTIFGESPDSQMGLTSQNLYSAEYVVLESGDVGDDELANDQVVSTIYDLEDSDGQ
jgi:predicted anti-sigma-YlaC factor YlaD